MNRLMFSAILGVAVAIVNAAPSLPDYDVYHTVPDPQNVPLKKVNTSTPVPTNSMDILHAIMNNLQTAKGKLQYVDVTPMHILLGYAAMNPATTGYPDGSSSVNLNPYWNYPSYTYGSFNINIGIDNKVGYNTGTVDSKGNVYNARYATAIGTSAKAKMMHSYAYGSQINALALNSTVMGYGGTAKDDWSTVIGHGKRPFGGVDLPEVKFASDEAVWNWLKTPASNLVKGMTFGNTNINDRTTAPGGYVVINLRSSPSAEGYLADFIEIPVSAEDIFAGQYDWRYGKSHGPGTFNIVAWHSSYGHKSPGLRAVWINDDNLFDLVHEAAGDAALKLGPELTTAQKNKGITYVSNGYAENGAVEIGVDAHGAVDSNVVAKLNVANSKIRNVGIAIGTRATALGSSDTKNQSIAIGYSAYASNSCAMAIGPGAKHFDDEDNDTGHNAVAIGSTAIAIGYAAKAKGTAALALGAGISGGKKTIASANGATAIGQAAQATAPNAVQIGSGVNSEAGTLKFRDTTIVRNGKVMGFDETQLDPQECDVSAAGGSTEASIVAKAHVINTLSTTNNLGPGSEIGVDPAGSRNYEIFIPNEESFRKGMPIGFMTEIDGVTPLFRGEGEWVYKLPAQITVRQPNSKYVIITSETMDDGYDWTPAITSFNLTVNSDSKIVMEEGKKYAVEGTNLQGAQEVSVVYPVTVNTTTNAVLAKKRDGDKHIDACFYNNALYLDDSILRSLAPVFTAAEASIRKLVFTYKTTNGTVTFTKNLTN